MTHNTPSEIRFFEVLELFRGESNIYRSCEAIDPGPFISRDARTDQVVEILY